MAGQPQGDPRAAAVCCDYCGLPTRGTLGSPGEPVFCCLGCQIADAIAQERADSDTGHGRTALQLGMAVFFSMNVMVFTLALWSWDTYAIASAPNAAILKELLRFACLLFSTPVVLLLGKPLLENVLRQLRGGMVTADVLLIVGVAAALIYSIVSLWTGQPHVYFEVACMILLAVTFGRWLEAEGKHRAMKSLQSLQNLLPTTARVVSPDGSCVDLALEEVQVGLVVRVLPGERFPLDGEVVEGCSFVDEQLVTGESQAVCKSRGDAVHGGTLNLDGRIDLLVRAAATEGTIPRLVASVRQAASQTCRPQRLADRLARVFVPLVVFITIVVFLTHWHANDLRAAWMSSMAVALIACPCALAIATPLAIWAALGRAAEQGVVFKTSDDLTTLSQVDTLCIDKTGTLTTNEPRLAGSFFDDLTHEATARDVVRQLAQQTRHPLADALQRWLGETPIAAHGTLRDATTVPGKGVRALWSPLDDAPASGCRPAVLGNREFLEAQDMRCSAPLREFTDHSVAQGLSVVLVGWQDQARAVFAFEESLRGDAQQALHELRERGLKILILTGDHQQRAHRMAEQLQVDVAAKLLPEDKLRTIANLRRAGNTVAMLGDGLNDAPALGAADVGIALGCGADVTRDAADVCLLSSALSALPWAVDLARATRRTIRRNLLWAVVYNSLGIGLAAAGKLNPMLAAVAMVFSSSFVIAESLRLGALAGPRAPLAESPSTRQAGGPATAADEPANSVAPPGRAGQREELVPLERT